MKDDKLYNTLLALYVEIYSHLDVDFNSIDKEDGFFMNYEIDREVEVRLVNDFLSRQKLTKPQKNIVSINYYLGCSPTHKK